MEDKEVGELWIENNDDFKRRYGTDGQNIVNALIRKLVEERRDFESWTHGEYCKCETDPDLHLRAALKEFDIDPKNWNR